MWRRAKHICWKRIMRELGYNRMTGLRKWQWALRKIVIHLNMRNTVRYTHSVLNLGYFFIIIPPHERI